jgi:DNA mismatch repair protein MSH4
VLPPPLPSPSSPSLDRRVKENLLNAYVMTNAVVQTLLQRVRADMNLLFRFAESVAMVDMLLSFAAVVVESPDPDAMARPTFTADGPIAIVKGRHPVVERASGGAYVPNDLTLTPEATLQVLTGPNCSGKSTFLRQAAVLVILAHIGSYVPAQSASIRLTDRICTRLGTGDDIEANASTFLKDMKETAFILANATDSSLVLIDELGRG